MALTYSIDPVRRRILIVVTAQPTAADVFEFMTCIFEDPAFEPGFDVLWDRSSWTGAPTREYIEQVVQWLRDRPQVGRVAVLVDASAPAAYGMARMLELLRDRDAEGRLRVFTNLGEAERWLDERLDASGDNTSADSVSAMSDATLWTLEKNAHKATAATRAIAGVGVELRFLWNGEMRQSQVYRNVVDLAAAADEKRRVLLDQGWVDAPPTLWGN